MILFGYAHTLVDWASLVNFLSCHPVKFILSSSSTCTPVLESLCVILKDRTNNFVKFERYNMQKRIYNYKRSFESHQHRFQKLAKNI